MNVLRDGGNIASYFCSPDGEVLQLEIGNAPDVFNVAQRAFEIHRQLEQTGESQKSPVLRELILAGAPEGARSLLKSLEALISSTGNQLTIDRAGCRMLSEMISIYYTQSHSARMELGEIMGNREKVAEWFENATKTTVGFSIRNLTRNRELTFVTGSFLAGLARIHLSLIEQTVFEEFLDEEYAVRTENNELLYQRFVEAQEESRHLLVLLTDEPGRHFIAEEELRRMRSIRGLLQEDLDIVSLTRDELFVLLTDTNNPPIPTRSGTRTISYILFSPDGTIGKTFGLNEKRSNERFIAGTIERERKRLLADR